MRTVEGHLASRETAVKALRVYPGSLNASWPSCHSDHQKPGSSATCNVYGQKEALSAIGRQIKKKFGIKSEIH